MKLRRNKHKDGIFRYPVIIINENTLISVHDYKIIRKMPIEDIPKIINNLDEHFFEYKEAAYLLKKKLEGIKLPHENTL